MFASLRRFWERQSRRPVDRLPRRRSYKPRLEWLEAIVAPAVLAVTSAADDGGAGTLRGRLGQAQPGDTVTFGQAVMGKTITLTGDIPVGGQSGNPITIDGANNNVTISGGNANRLFEVTQGDLTIQNLTLTNGQIAGGNSGGAILIDTQAYLFLSNDTFTNNQAVGNGSGGAIENDGALTVNGCTFQSNSADSNGGAIDSVGSPGVSLIVSSSKFYGNFAGNSGGAIATLNDTVLNNGDVFGGRGMNQSNVAVNNGGAVLALGNASHALTVVSCTFDTDNALGNVGFGGAIATSDSTDLEVSTFTNCSAVNGGGVFDQAAGAANSTLIVNQCTFSLDLATTGGGLSVNAGPMTGTCNCSITQSTFNNNSADPSKANGQGGGLYLFQAIQDQGQAHTLLVNDTFFTNQARYGGGFYVLLNTPDQNSNNVNLTSLTVNANQASVSGGGMYADGGNAPPPAVSIQNSILDGNTVTAPGYMGPLNVTLTAMGLLNDQNYNLVGLSDTVFTAMNDIHFNDPGLANALAANGAKNGFPLTLALSRTSIAYHRGLQALAGMTGQPQQLDARGRTRQANGMNLLVSIGAEDPDAM